MVLVAVGATVQADIIINGSDEFIMKVEEALKKIKDAGGDAADNVSDLEGSDNDHVIEENSGLSSVTPDSGNDALDMGSGGTGKGSGTTTKWDPDHMHTYKDGVDRDPCAALAHELNHANDADGGGWSNDKTGGILDDEIDACSDENEFRKSQGLPPRTKYGCNDLPEHAVCPPAFGSSEETADQGSTDFDTAISSPVSSGTTTSSAAPTMVAIARPFSSVKLTAAVPAAPFLLGDPVDIQLTLTNNGPGATELSPIIEGNFRVVSVTRDGRDVLPVSSISVFNDELAYSLEQTLQSVGVGGSTSLTWRSGYRSNIGGQGLTSVSYSSSDHHPAHLYSLNQSGSYEIRVFYKYAGLDAHSNPYKGKTNTVTIKFDVL
ncbi:hypothetical protein ABI59_16500 [Acidobacteria bacterium Mor1]|nr:hypothetical protein ABI59_16500 [Acidobacteria bacterium Mor1]